MDIKMIDVARHLGISKATVSLAVNNRPGVSEKTKNLVLNCIEEMKNTQPNVLPRNLSEPGVAAVSNKRILIGIISHQVHIVYDPSFDLMTSVIAEFTTYGKKYNYNVLSLTIENSEEAMFSFVDECNKPSVAGVILLATEMTAYDLPYCDQIQKPLILYDYYTKDGRYSSVCIDNKGAVSLAFDELLRFCPKTIKYFANSTNIYNFQKRRQTFRKCMTDISLALNSDDLLFLGSSAIEMRDNIMDYLSKNAVPDAIITENYKVSLALIDALRALNIQPGKDCHIVGIDELMPLTYGADQISQIIIPHIERVPITMDLLQKEIEGTYQTTFRIYAATRLKSAY